MKNRKKGLKRFAALVISIIMLIGTSGFSSAEEPTTSVFNKAYIPGYGSNKMDVLNLKNHTIEIGKITVGNGPVSAAISPAGDMILVSNYTADSVSVIDPSTDTVTRTLSSGFSNPMGIAFNSDGSKAYVTSNNSTTLTVIDTQTWAQSSITLSGVSCSAVTIGNDVYITSLNSTNFYKIDTITDTVSATINLGSGNQGIAANLDGTKLYVACTNGSLKVINLSDFSIESSHAVGNVLSGVDISSDGTKIYVVDRSMNTFHALDAADYSLLGSVPVGGSSWGLGIQGDYAYVLGMSNSTVYIINLNTYTLADTISTTLSPVSFGTFMVSSKMYAEVGPSSDAALSALSLSSGTLSPVFGADTTAYTASVVNSVTSLKVTPTANDANATVTVQDVSVSSGSESGWINLAVGDNAINVVVTAEDVSTKTYTITVTRLPDTTAPALTAGDVSRTGDTAGTVKFTSDAAGSYYYAVVDDGAAPPVIVTTGAGIACTTLETTITDPTGLTAGAKDIYIKVKDAAGNVSDALKIDIAAYVAPDTTAPRLTAVAVSRTGNTAGTVKFTSDVAGSYYYVVVDDGAAPPVIVTTGAGIACTTLETTITDPTGLTAGAKDIYIKVKDAAGNVSDALKIDIAAYVAPKPEYDDEPETDASNRAEVLVNGQAQTAGTVRTSMENDRTITTVTVDADKLQDILENEGDGPTVTIPFMEGSDTSSGILTGQMIKNMEKKAATLAVKTDSSTYTLPAQEINIDKVAEQFGENVGLSDIKVEVTISEPDDSTVQVTENAAKDGGFTLMVQPVEFTVKCSHKGKIVEVESYNAYVERTIKIPDGVSPNKITTAVVVNADGTVRHVPTKIMEIDGVYYAVINSLTNSAYTLINRVVEYGDIEGHWAQGAMNDMGSRMVINGDENGDYNPEDNMTRAEFTAIVLRALGLAEGIGENTFSDVTGQDSYCGYIETASAYGIITGYPDGNFGPNDVISP